MNRDALALLKAARREPKQPIHLLALADWLDEEGLLPAWAAMCRQHAELLLWGDCTARPRAYRNWNVDCRPCAGGRDDFCGLPGRRCEFHQLAQDITHARRLVQNELFLSPDGVIFPSPFKGVFLHNVRCTPTAWKKHGPAALAWHPVKEVSFTTLCPMATGNLAPAAFCWTLVDESWHHARPPLEWWGLMAQEHAVDANGDIAFARADEACAALSKAALKWAKAEAKRSSG